MIVTLDAENVPKDIQLPKKGWETVVWFRSWSNVSDDVYYHLIRISRVKTIKRITHFQAHFQLYRNNRVRKYDILEEMAEQY